MKNLTPGVIHPILTFLRRYSLNPFRVHLPKVAWLRLYLLALAPSTLAAASRGLREEVPLCFAALLTQEVYIVSPRIPTLIPITHLALLSQKSFQVLLLRKAPGPKVSEVPPPWNSAPLRTR